MFLKSIQHLSLGNAVTSSDKNIEIVWFKYICISNSLHNILYMMHIQNTHLK